MGESCELDDTTVATAACVARVAELHQGTDQGQQTHAIPAYVRRTVLHRDRRRCRVPGCQSRLWCDLHQLVGRRQGGTHTPDNLVCLCSAHHALLHEGRLAVEHIEDVLDVSADAAALKVYLEGHPEHHWTCWRKHRLPNPTARPPLDREALSEVVPSADGWEGVLAQLESDVNASIDAKALADAAEESYERAKADRWQRLFGPAVLMVSKCLRNTQGCGYGERVLDLDLRGVQEAISHHVPLDTYRDVESCSFAGRVQLRPAP